MNYQELQAALRVFGLGDRASLKEIKARHRQLVKEHHPDANAAAAAETIREINAAYRIILAYLEEYRFSFSAEEFWQQNPEARLRHQFGHDPLWGKG